MQRRARGSITPWNGGYRVRLSVDAERISLGVYPTRAAAERALAAAVRETGADARTGVTLAEYGARWLERREREGLHRSSADDRRRWSARIATAPFIDRELKRIDARALNDWIRAELRSKASRTAKGGGRVQQKTVARQTVVNAFGLLRSCLASALAEGLIKSNPALGLRVPRTPRTDEPWTYLSASEAEAVMSCAQIPERERTVFTVAILTGLRAGELWGLRWADVLLEGDRAELVVRHSFGGPTKTGRVRRVPLLPRARAALTTWREQSPGIGHALVWPARHGGCHGKGYDAQWSRWRRVAGIERAVRLHDLRHTCASHLVMGTWCPRLRLEDVRQWLGHSSVTVTERYAHLAPSALHEAARIETDGHVTDTTKKKEPRK